MQTIPLPISDAVHKEIQGESILWAGSPSPWSYARRHWKTALFGIPFTAFAVYWTFGATRISGKGDSSFPWFFLLWGLMFVGFGLSMLLRPLWAAWTARSVLYVVTGQRAIIFEKPLFLKIRSFSPFVVSGYERVSHGGQSGDLIFMQVQRRGGKGRTYTVDVGFLGLTDCSIAEGAIKQMLSLAVNA